MKSIPKLISRFAGIMILSIVLLLLLNFIFLAIIVSQSTNKSPWETANKAVKALQVTDRVYSLSDEMVYDLMEQNIWAVYIDNDTMGVVWHTENLPNTIPMQYTISDIANLTRGYIDEYPTFTGAAENGLIVLGYAKDSFWKHMYASWDFKLIANLPLIALFVLGGNIALIFLIYVVTNSKLLRSVNPITNGIQDLSSGSPVYIKETGLFSELAENINKTSVILQEQARELKKKDTARANWIAGISHDIRTPLSMVMGYAGQLGNDKNLSDVGREKAVIILKQSERIKNLINDLNLASKLEYNMQPLKQNPLNVVALVRKVVVDFINMDIDDKFPIEWITSEELSSCIIHADNDLLKRAVENLIQNSMNHNKDGCTIYVSVKDVSNDCFICVEDSGMGVSDEDVQALNSTPHYMVCDTNTTEQRHGIGLLIVKQIITVHNGTMTIDHSVYGGFKVVLKLAKRTLNQKIHTLNRN